MDNNLGRLEYSSISADHEPPGLGNLPNELKIMILKNIPDLPSLIHLVHSAPEYWAVFVSKRHEILSVVSGLVKIQPEVLIDAVAVSLVSVPITIPRLEPRGPAYWFRAWGKQFMERPLNYHLNRCTRVPRVPAMSYTEDLNALHLTICDLTQHFIAAVLSQDQFERLEGLSKTEEQRIYRAFYRFELFQKLFPKHAKLGSCHWQEIDFVLETFTVNISILTTGYFSMFEPFEVEEIACIQNFIWKIYAKALDTYGPHLSSLNKFSFSCKYPWNFYTGTTYTNAASKIHGRKSTSRL